LEGREAKGGQRRINEETGENQGVLMRVIEIENMSDRRYHEVLGDASRPLILESRIMVIS
jgi:hypothetical protein